ncbi:Zinc finger protein [Dirofilaria immitis]
MDIFKYAQTLVFTKFIILNEIKQNQCTCSCSCLPRTQHVYSATTKKLSSNEPSLDKTIYSPVTWSSAKISKQHLEHDLAAETANSTMKICTTSSSKAPLERNESTTIIVTCESLTKIKHVQQSISQDSESEATNSSILMNETRFGTNAKERYEEKEIEGTKFKIMLEKDEWKTAEEREGPVTSYSAQAKTDQVTREEGKHQKEVEDLEFKNTLKKEWETAEEGEGSMPPSSVQAKTDQVTREEGKHEEVGDIEFKNTLRKELETAEEGEGSMPPSSVQAKTDQVTREEGKHEEVGDIEFKNALVKEEWETAEEGEGSVPPSSVQAKTDQVTREEGKHQKEVEDLEFTEEGEGSMPSSSVQVKTDQVTREEGKHQKEVEDLEFTEEGEGSMPSSSVQVKTDQVTREEGKHEGDIGDLKLKKILEKEWKVMQEEKEPISFSLQAETNQLTGEKGKYEEETEHPEFKKLLEKERKTMQEEGSISSTAQSRQVDPDHLAPDWQSDPSFLPFVSRKTDQVTRITVEEGKYEEETKDSEFKKMLEKERKKVQEEGLISSTAQSRQVYPDQLASADWIWDISLPPFVLGNTDVTVEGKHEEEMDSESKKMLEREDQRTMQEEGPMLSLIQAEINQVTLGTVKEGKNEEETEGPKYQEMLKKEWKTVEEEEVSMSPFIQAKIDQVKREEGKHVGIEGSEHKKIPKKEEWRKAQEEGSILSTVQSEQVDLDQLASEDWKPNASLPTSVLRKTDQNVRGTIEEGKQEEEAQGSEFTEMLEEEERRTVHENEGLMSTVDEEKNEEQIGDLFKKMLKKEERRAERKDDSMSSFTQAQQATDFNQSTSTNSKLNPLFSPFLTMKAGEIMHGSTTNATDLAKMELIKMIDELSMVRQSKMRKNRRYGTEEIVSASEIVPKKTKFERKRLDVAKKTDSNDIYIRNHLLTTVPITVQLQPWNSDLQTTNYSSFSFEGDISFIDKHMNKTQEESMNKSRNDTRNETMLSDSKIEIDNNRPSDEVKLKVIRIEAAKSRSTIKVPAEIEQKVHVSEKDYNHGANKILGEVFATATVTTKLPERKKTGIKVYWTESLEKAMIANDSMRELESDESHFTNHSEIIGEQQQATYFDSEETGATNIPTASVDDTSAQSNISVVFSDTNYSADAPKRIPIKKIKKFCMQLPTTQQGYSQQVENLVKNRKLNFFSHRPEIHLSHARNTSGSDTIVFDPLEKRKTLEERRRTILMKIKRIYAKEEGKEKMESREGEKREEIMGSIGLQEEKARLEEARLLREEQMELRKHQQLYHGFADRAHLERHEQINHQLHLLAESERQHREQLEREERTRLARTKHNKITSNGDNFSIIPTSITTLSGFDNQRNEEKMLTAEQCSLIRKFVRVFNIANPVEWIRLNCPIARIYFSEASCEQMQKLFESCFQ